MQAKTVSAPSRKNGKEITKREAVTPSWVEACPSTQAGRLL